MKVAELPQDAKFFKNTIIRDIAYATNDNGDYISVVSEGWDVKNDALDLTWEIIREKCEEIRKQVLLGKISPLAYHLEKNIMNIGLFSKYTGQTKRKIKKHLKSDRFNNLDDNILRKYAEVLRISVEELKSV